MESHMSGLVEGAPYAGTAIDVICIPSFQQFSKLSRDDRPVGRGLTFVTGDIATCILTVTAWHLLLPTSYSCTAISAPYGAPSTYVGGVQGFHVSLEEDLLG